MKTFISFLFILFYASMYGQFLPKENIDTTVAGSFLGDVNMADLNNDGHLDLLFAHRSPGKISVYMNDSTGHFDNEIVVSSFTSQALAASAGDFNGDGWLDVAGLTSWGKTTMHINNGDSSFTSSVLDSGMFFPIDVAGSDLDHNGYADVLSLGDTSLHAYYMDSLGGITSSVVAHFTEFYCMTVGDINGDGYDDVILGSGKFYTFINDQNGGLIRDNTNESILPKGLIFQVELADMNGDNELDLVVYYTNVIDKVDWYSNDGNGKFTLETTITSKANNIHDLTFGDIDDDNDLDVCLAYDQTNELVWIENLGNGIFSPEKVIDSNFAVGREMELGDLDGDGDVDLVAGANNGLFKFLNTTHGIGIQEYLQYQTFLYPNPADQFFYSESVFPLDVMIFNCKGQMIKNSLDMSPGKNRIDVSTMESGIYYVRTRSRTGENVFKLFIE